MPLFVGNLLAALLFVQAVASEVSDPLDELSTDIADLETDTGSPKLSSVPYMIQRLKNWKKMAKASKRNNISSDFFYGSDDYAEWQKEFMTFTQYEELADGERPTWLSEDNADK